MKQSSVFGSFAAWATRVVIVAVVAAFAFLAPLNLSDRQQDTASITTYDATMDLSADGTLVTDERIQVQLPAGKHGIFRIFDTADPRRNGVDHPVTDVSVQRGESSEPTTWVSSAAGTKSLRIGSESRILPPGEHVYRIRSTTTDVLEPGEEGETLLWWDVIGSGWQMPMGSAQVRIDLPAEPLRAECVMGEDTPCEADVDGRSLVVTTGRLAPFTPVTVRVAFPADALPEPPGSESQLPTIVLSVLAAAAAAWLGFRLVRATREASPGFPVVFEPPAGVGPALAARVLNEQHSSDDLQATLYALAERGIVRLEGDDDQWRIEVLTLPASAPLSPVETAVLQALDLHGVGSSFTVSSSATAGEQIGEARSALRREVDRAAATYLERTPAGVAGMVLGWLAAVAVLVIGGIALFSGAGWRPWPLLLGLAVFVVVVAGMLFDGGVLTKRTAAGRDLWSRAGGFARFLTTDSAESRFEAAKHLDWYPRYLPYALVFGSADAWARRFESQGVGVPPVPWILWTGHGLYSADRMGTSFNAAIGSAAAAYAASQASSSGGGFSGGSGGGGGGGGSW